MKSAPMRQKLILIGLVIFLGLMAHGAHAQTTFTVTNTSDGTSPVPANSLRAAINYANVNPGTTITFNILHTDSGYDVATGTFSIKPGSALPSLASNNIEIDGTSQPDYTTSPVIVLDGSVVTAGTVNGLDLNGVTGCAVQGLSINNFSNAGIEIEGAGAANNTIAGNYIGLNAAATGAAPNYIGVYLNGVSGNLVGGTTAAARNVISGNNYSGVDIDGGGTSGNTVEGNYIGTNVVGTGALANVAGGILLIAPNNTIGGTVAGAGNVISGNSDFGIGFYTTSSSNTIENNYIGTDSTGTAAVANIGNGVDITSPNNLIGTAGAGNIIAFNTLHGVSVSSSTATGNLIHFNSIHDNAKLGINLVGGTEDANSVTANDAKDSDTGPNNLQNYPIVTGVTNGSNAVVSGTLNSVPGITYIIDFYSNATPDPSGYGEGQTYLGTTTTGTTDGNGDVSFTYNSGANLTGKYITATATDPGGNTSEFSQAFSNGAVLNTNDSGTGSLRAAITYANANPGTAIIFNIPTSDTGYSDPARGGTGAFTIAPASVLPSITANGTIIDGTTQTTTNPNGPEIIIDGTAVGGAANSIDGIDIHDAANCQVQGLVINNWDGGICIRGVPATNNTVQGCYIGTNATGTTAAPNNSGIEINSGAHDNTIGSASTLNVISGNNVSGIDISDTTTTGNVVVANYIGTNKNGTAALPNQNGITIEVGATNNTIGGTGANQGNIISGNTKNGIEIIGDGMNGGATARNNTVAGNYIGTNSSSSATLGNGIYGITISATSYGNTIGGATASARNFISGNGSSGIALASSAHTNLIAMNYIGTNIGGTAALANGGDGISLTTNAYSNTIGAGNLISGNIGNGILNTGANTNSNIFSGNLIGTDATGMSTVPNAIGVQIADTATNHNTIGGTTASARNVISGNTQYGVFITTSANQTDVQGNYIGVNINGTGALPNGTGVQIDTQAYNNVIGGTTAGAINIISGNTDAGIGIGGNNTTSNTIVGNYIGTDNTGKAALHNNYGVIIATGAQSNIIGDSTGATHNIISGNAASGILIENANTNSNQVLANYIGTDKTGNTGLGNSIGVTISTGAQSNLIGGTSATPAVGNLIAYNVTGVVVADGIAAAGSTMKNAIEGNSIHDNTGLGLNLAGGTEDSYGVTANDSQDTDTGPNNLQNFPVFNGVALSSGNAILSGALNSVPNAAFRVDLYRNTTTTAAGYGEGQTYAGTSSTITTDANGDATFTFTDTNFPGGPQYYTATATRLQVTPAIAPLDTSEFSADFAVSTKSVYIVTNTNATGGGSLRNAILFANANPGTTIQFNIPGTGTQTISPTAANPLPAITAANTTIDGYTQPGASVNTLATGDNAVLKIVINGTGSLGGLVINNVSSCLLQGLVVGNATTGISITGANAQHNTVQGCFLGTNAAGATALGNSSSGISISAASSNTIGGTTVAARNLISGNNSTGIALSGASSNVVQNNYVGLNAGGSAALANGGIGVSLDGDSHNNLIGGNTNTAPLAGNVIAGNNFEGISMQSAAAPAPSGNTISGNVIGLDATGATAIANHRNGLNMTDNCVSNIIGGMSVGDGNIISGNLGHGVALSGTGTNDNKVQGNLIGVNRAGTAAISNGFDGVVVLNGPQRTIIGGTGAASNVLSGNAAQGLSISGSGTGATTVQGNYIGTNATGTAALGNGTFGVGINASSNNTIGGTTADTRNIISGNGNDGVNIQGSGSDNTVEGNYIGTDNTGKVALANLRGVNIFGSAQDNTIGGTATGASNIIAFNTGSGVQIGQSATGNTIEDNAIFSNGGLGINLQPNGEAANTVTPNDAGDADTGPNNLQNFPMLAVVTAGSQTTIGGTLNSAANTKFTIDYYRNSMADASGYGQGVTYLGVETVTTDASGNASLNFSVSGPVTGQVFTATATNTTTGDTSEFAQDQSAQAAALTLSVATAPVTNPPTFNEGAGVTAAIGTVTRNTPLTAALSVTLTSNRPDKATAPATVTIPAGQTTATFPIAAVDNAIADGNQTVTFTAMATSLPAATATATVLDNDQSGIAVTPTTGLTTTTAGGTSTFTIQLNSQPTSDVTIPLTSSDATIGTVAPASLTFTPQDYSVPQTVTVTGTVSKVDKGNQTYTISVGPAQSSDSVYQGAQGAGVTVTNLPAGKAHLIVMPTSGLVTSQAGKTATFTVKLATQPTANVHIGLMSSDKEQGIVRPQSLGFTPQDWNTPQTVTITGVDNHTQGQATPYQITLTTNSPDSQYNNLSALVVTVTNQNTDQAGVTLSTTRLTTTAAGGKARFAIRLNTRPIANVVIPVVSSDPSQGRATPSLLTFTPVNWQVAQYVTVTGVDDLLALAKLPYHINLGPASSKDGFYEGLKLPVVTVVNLENRSLGFTLTPQFGLMTTTAGGTATFTVQLNSQPKNTVTLDLSSSNPHAGLVRPTLLTFTPKTWDMPQTVTVTGLSDNLRLDKTYYYILLSPAHSADLQYRSLKPPFVRLFNANVSGPPKLKLTPLQPMLLAGQSQQFMAPVLGLPNATLRWRVQEGDAGGEITQQGLYTAPQFPGTYHVVVSVAGYPNLVQTATVQVVTATSVAFGWGDNSFGEIGDNNTNNQPLPQLVDNLTSISAVAAGGAHSLALSQGQVYAWGYNGAGALGDDTEQDRTTPVPVKTLTHATAIAAGWYHSLAVQDGRVWAWGLNDSGQLGDGTTNNSSTPVPVQNLTGVKAVAAGLNYSLALTNDGKVWAWGNNYYGQLGSGAPRNSNVPVLINLPVVKAISAGAAHGVAVLMDGSARAWGWNHYGQLGIGASSDSAPPTPVLQAASSTTMPSNTTPLANVKAVAAGYAHTLFLLDDHTVAACGNNAYGQLGNAGHGTDSHVVFSVQQLTGATAIAAGAGHSLALLTNGSVMAWGDNSQGQLGDGSTTNQLLPKTVSRLQNIKAIAAGYQHSLAVSAGNAMSGQATSLLSFSSGQVNAAHANATLNFGGALAADVAADADHYSVSVNGHAVNVESAAYSSKAHQVLLSLPDGALQPGDKVTIAWHDLQDAKAHAIVDGQTVLVAR